MEKPTKSWIIRFTSDPVEPTAAIACGLTKRPTTTMSAALNSSCSIEAAISGSAKVMTFGMMAPVVISISYFLLISHTKQLMKLVLH